MYLAHGIVFCSLIDRIRDFDIPKFILGVIAICLSITATIVIHDFLEKPIQKFLKEKLLYKN